MFHDDLMLDELNAILLLDGHKHPDDVAKQVAPTLGHAVKEQRMLERPLDKFAVFLVERIRLEAHDRSSGRSFPPSRDVCWSNRNVGHESGS
jgi:hypothetical protein